MWSNQKDQRNPNNDNEVVSPPEDGISSITFSPAANFMAATSWDQYVRIWEVTGSQWGGGNAQSQSKVIHKHTSPILCSGWSDTGSQVFFGGTDGQVKMWDLASNQCQQVGHHGGGVKAVFHIPQHQQLVSGSWDKSLKYWDLRNPNPNPTFAFSLPERCYTMDVKGHLMVVGTANRQILVFDIRSPQSPLKQITSPLKWQTRCVACFSDMKGYFVGSIEGRVAVQNLDEATASQKNFTFKCHRQNNSEVYAINSIAVHPTLGSFVTAGSDGCYHFWDKESKRRLKAMERTNESISCGAFNRDGSIYAYAVSYDWSKGCRSYNPQTTRNTIMLHSIAEIEVMAKSANNPTRRR
ncbi:hypothetical protein BSKO_12786 [Bryopsis sp. KO-2023]|nr:hypothetical protein BSKO_12786 [Bryopsis sp. KO-2023]